MTRNLRREYCEVRNSPRRGVPHRWPQSWWSEKTLNGPSLEKATSGYRATWGTSTGLRASQTVLASRPRDGAINRIVTPTVPIQLTYELTALGTELTLHLRNPITWIDDHTSTILKAQAAYDADTPLPPAGEGGDRVHRLHRVQRGGRGTAGR